MMIEYILPLGGAPQEGDACLTDVLILTVPFGRGHVSAAEAIAQAIPAGHSVHVQDIYAVLGPRARQAAGMSYAMMMRYAGRLYGLAYRLTEGARAATVPAGRGEFVVATVGPALLRVVEGLRPRTVIATHPACSMVAAWIKRRVPFRLLSVLTDYTVHGLAVVPGVDAYCLPLPDLIPEMTRRGVPADALHPTGIPVRSLEGSSSGLRRELGLPAGVPAVLVMCGGMALGPVEEAARALLELPDPILVLAATGENHRTASRLRTLEARHPGRLRVLTVADPVDRYLAAADLLVTKPGGLTLAEAAVRGTPLLLLPAMPGQEERNRARFCSEGAAVPVELRTLGPTVQVLLRNPERVAAMRRALARLARPEAARAVAALALAGAEPGEGGWVLAPVSGSSL